MGDRRRGSVWISEDDEFDDDPCAGLWFLGTFSAEHHSPGQRKVYETLEGVTIDEALAWGRERAQYVTVDVAWSYRYNAGEVPYYPDLPTWPPPDQEPLVRRREHRERWRDRAVTDPPIEWTVVASLYPPIELGMPPFPTETWDRLVASRAAAAGAERWDGNGLAGYAADLEQAKRDADRRGLSEFSYMTAHTPAYRVWFERVVAATEDQAIEAVGLTPPAGWPLQLMARPAGHPAVDPTNG